MMGVIGLLLKRKRLRSCEVTEGGSRLVHGQREPEDVG